MVWVRMRKKQLKEGFENGRRSRGRQRHKWWRDGIERDEVEMVSARSEKGIGSST